MTEYDSGSSSDSWSSSDSSWGQGGFDFSVIAQSLLSGPELADRDWLEQQHQRYTRAATRPFNIRG
jgi:hypothetical protein